MSSPDDPDGSSRPNRPTQGFGPYRPGAHPPPRQPGRGWLPLLIGATAVGLVAAIVMVVSYANRTGVAAAPTPGAGSSGPTGAGTVIQSTADPTASPTTTDRSDDRQTGASTATSARQSGSSTGEPSPSYGYTKHTAKDSVLYNVVFKAGAQACANIAIYTPPIPDPQLKSYARKIVDCLVTVNAPRLAGVGITLRTPKVALYRGRTTTPCGPTGPPSYYCSVNQTIYLDQTADDARSGYYQADKGYWFLLSHEFGHHLQQAGGIFASYTEDTANAGADQDLELSRRLELQATCFGAVFLNATYGSLRLTPADYDQYVRFLTTAGDETNRLPDHGSAVNNKAWFDRGYFGPWSSYGDCNTWTASNTDVG